MRHLLPLAALLVAACNATDDQSAIGGVSAGEAAALNDAAAMLDDNAMMTNTLAAESGDRP